jgi:hypothetical protein
MNGKNIGRFMANYQSKILAMGLMDARDNGLTIIGLLSDLLVFRMSSDEGPLFVSDELLLNLLTAERFLLNGDLVVSQSQEKARRSLEALGVLINATLPVGDMTDSKAGKAPNLDRYRPLIFTAAAFLETELSGVRAPLAGSNKQGGTCGNQG